MRFLELKLLPPLLALLIAAGMWALAQFTPRLDVPLTYRLLASLAVALPGVAIATAAFVLFFRARTTILPTRPERSTTLITTGVYAFTRNPMYLGVLLVLTAWALYLAAPGVLLGPLLFWLLITHFQIIPEERILTQVFGQAYTQYCAKVPRWI